MPPTEKFCKECIAQLSPATAKIPEERAFLSAQQWSPGGRPRGTGPRSEMGRCFKCGKETVVTFYED
jgi:hypothetical protein